MPTDFVTPPALEPGDQVAVLAPSSGGAHDAPHLLDIALDRLRDVFDLDPVVYPTARQGNDFVLEHPRARAADVHAAFRDPDFSGVFATIGSADKPVDGRLWDRSLSIVDWHLASDRYLPAPERLDGTVLCIETAEDLPRPGDVETSLIVMGERGLLDRFDGVLFGRPPTRSFAADPPGGDRKAYREQVYDHVAE